MTAQQGFQYEVNAANFLKPLGLVPKSFTPAGASHDQPDLMLQYKKKTSGCELKITDASAGSLVLKYDITNKRQPWAFNDIDANDDEKLFLRDLAIRSGALKRINATWKESPIKRDKDKNWQLLFGKLTPEQRYRRDLELFRDIKEDIPASEISDYYNTKKTFYVNVGTHGFYLFGNKDELGLSSTIKKLSLPSIPKFENAARAWYRARVQYKGSGNYQFTFELQFKVQTKSPYNIAPITKTSVAILEQQAALQCFTQ